ncbi:hypothetical protein L9F63_015557 [Diploptera punctata]|uniref:DNA repair metallo-beta-lactamase domain-containing protein n=1 Tax=Diploptera punctata TaxID=6984 RepID=A0AAD8A5C7_DIPPU|nr:hypothetical protein L9F63_015557 [Diploptera punctata]
MFDRMDEQEDDFPLLSMSGISLHPEIPSSQSSSISRLSKTFRKGNVDSIYCSQQSSLRLSRSFRNKHSSSSQSCGDNLMKNDPTTKTNNSNATVSSTVEFCPICQIPFDILAIDKSVHVNQCTVAEKSHNECPDGELCYSYNIFHYRDYTHNTLARIRASKGHVESYPSITPPKSTGKKKKNSSTFKPPLSKCVNINVSNCKKKLFTQNGSPVTSSADSNQDVNMKTSLNCRNILTIANAGYKSPPNEVSKINKFTYEPETRNKIVDNRSKRQIDDIDSSESDFKVPTKRKKRGNEFINSVKTNIQNQEFTSPSKFNKINGSHSEKIDKNVTILDTIDSSLIKCVNIAKDECYRETQKITDLHTCDNKVNNLIEECTNCNKSPNKENKSLLEDKEVRATLSVIVSPTSGSVDDAVVKDEPETPVKVDASCDKLGWKTVEIAAPSAVEVDNVKVAICNCTKTMEVNCLLSQNQTMADNLQGNNEELEVKFFSHIKEPKQFNTLNVCKSPSKLSNHQMSITSYFQTTKQPSNLYLKSCIESNIADVQPSSSNSAQNQNSTKANGGGTTSEMTRENKELAIASWKEIMRGMVQKGMSAMSVMSDDSLATNDTQTSSESVKRYQKSNKTCPFYKKIPDTSFVVDAFQYGTIPRQYYSCISQNEDWSKRGIRKRLELDIPKNINGVLLIKYNSSFSCPGSVMFLFQLQDGRNFLHVGDFRADPKMESYPCFWNLTIHKLYLDTTYCEPKYDFPMQSETVTRVVDLALEHQSKHPFTLFVSDASVDGKEKVFIGIAEALNCKIWAHPDKTKVLQCIDNPVINEKLTKKQLEAQVHVCRMHDLNNAFLQGYLQQHKGVFTHLVAFIPTGWEMKSRKSNCDDINMTSYGNVTIYGVPYSEHSSFTELKRFVQFLKPEEVIPTVNMGNAAKRKSMQNYFTDWLSAASLMPTKAKNQVQQKLINYFDKRSI